MNRHITVKGDAFDVGVQLGRAAAGGVQNAVFGSAEYAALKRWRGSDRLRELEDAARQTFPRLMRQFEGIAEGAGVSPSDLLLWNCRGDLRVSEGAPEGCTTVMLPGQALGAANVIGHNEDGDAVLRDYWFLATVEATDGPGFTAFCYPGTLPGHAFGVNDRGLVQTINNIGPWDQRPGVPRHFVTRAVLDCGDLDAAVATIRDSRRASGFHHALMQAGDWRVLSVEAPASVCSVVEVDAPQAHANPLVHPRTRDMVQQVTESSATRQARAVERVGEAAPEEVLFDRATAPLPIHRKALDGPDYGYTFATALFSATGTGDEAARVDWRVTVEAGAEPLAAGTVGR